MLALPVLPSAKESDNNTDVFHAKISCLVKWKFWDIDSITYLFNNNTVVSGIVNAEQVVVKNIAQESK